MSKIIQFRCPKDLKLLIKYDKLTEEVIYTADDVGSQHVKETNDQLIQCPKCKTVSKITPEGLQEVVMKRKVLETDHKIESGTVKESEGVKVD